MPDRANGAAEKGNYLGSRSGAVTLHGIAATTRPGTEFRFMGTALVDYRPATAAWRFFDAERTRVLSQHEGAGTAFATTERVVAFEVTITGLDEAAAHEVATFVELAPRDAADSSDADVRRWAVVSGTAALPRSACVDTQPSAFEEREQEMRRQGLTTGLARVVRPERGAALERGAKIAVTFENPGPGPLAVLGLLDGVPIAPAQIVRVASGDGEVAHRAEFLVNRAPQIGFVGAVWRDPFDVSVDSQWTTNFATTNFIPAPDGGSR